MRLTLKEARQQLYTAAVPNLDSQQNIERFNQLCNLACERLINSGTWSATYQHVRFPVDNIRHYISLPPQYLSVLAVSYEREGENGCVSTTPVQIRNEWLTVLGNGPFLWDFGSWADYGFQAWTSYSDDQGDGFCTFRDSPYAEYYLRFEIEDANDATKQILVKGFDQDERIIYSPAAPNAFQGILVTLANPSVTTSQVFTRQLSFIQKPLTQGYVKLYAVDVDTAEEVQIGEYQPSESNPCYHRYRIAKCSCDGDNGITHVRTILKRRYFPAVSDLDEVFPTNLGALRKTIAALKYEEQNDEGRYQINFDGALSLLNDETKSARGGAAMKLRIDGTAYQFQGLYVGR